MAALLAAIAIFPAISNSDDLLSYSLLNAQLGQHGGFGTSVPADAATERATLQLVRALEALEHCPTAQIFALTLVLFCISFICMLRPRLQVFTAACRPGRAPPSA